MRPAGMRSASGLHASEVSMRRWARLRFISFSLEMMKAGAARVARRTRKSKCRGPRDKLAAARHTVPQGMTMIQRFDVGRRLSEMAVHNGVVYLAGQVANDASQDI